MPTLPNVALVLGGVEHEGLVELVGHFDQGPHHGVDQSEGTHSQLGHRANADRVSDLVCHEIEDLAGCRGFGTGEVPYPVDGTLVRAQGGQTCCDVGHVAVGVRQIRVADEVGPTPRQGVGKDPLAQR